MAASDDHVRQLDRLTELLGSQGAVARLLDTKPTRISEWRRTGVKPRVATLRRIADATAAVDALHTRAGGHATTLRSLLETPLPEFAGGRPSELIPQGRGAEIVAAFAAPAMHDDAGVAELDLVEALIELAQAARASARALQVARNE